MLASEQKLAAAKLLLTPIVRFFLRQALHFPDFLRVAKAVFLEVAEEELLRRRERINVSRVSVLTGIQRYEIIRLKDLPKNPVDETKSVVGRVLGLWCNHTQFCSRPGHPRVLEYRGQRSEFKKLVEKVTKAINPGTVQFELERQGYVIRTSRGLKLNARLQTYAGDLEGGMRLLSKDIDDLVQCGYENLTGNMKGDWNLHIRTEYDNVAVSRIEEIKAWLLDQGKEIHRKARDYIAQFDQDVTSTASNSQAGARIVFTAFSACELPKADAPNNVFERPVKKSTTKKRNK